MRDSKFGAASGEGESTDGLRADAYGGPPGRASDEPSGESGDEALALPLRGYDEAGIATAETTAEPAGGGLRGEMNCMGESRECDVEGDELCDGSGGKKCGGVDESDCDRPESESSNSSACRRRLDPSRAVTSF